MSTDTEWEKWGQRNPYYGTLAREQFRCLPLSDKAKREFFESGREHVDHVMEICRRHLDSCFKPKNILDFGCGPGRLLIPFAEIADHVTGLDVSEAMLEEGNKNCREFGVNNILLLKSDDNLSCLSDKYDFIHSYIVFQHISIERGERIFNRLLEQLSGGGIGAIHFTFSNPVINAIFGRRWNLYTPQATATSNADSSDTDPANESDDDQDPEMKMNPYNINELFFLMQSTDIENLYTEFTDHNGQLGIFLYFQKPKLK